MPRKVSATVIQTFILLSYKLIYSNGVVANHINETVLAVHGRGRLFVLSLFSPFAQ